MRHQYRVSPRLIAWFVQISVMLTILFFLPPNSNAFQGKQRNHLQSVQDLVSCDCVIPGVTNLVTNGDFEAGSVGFRTSLTENTTTHISFGQYRIGTEAYDANAYWISEDHTTGSGKFMMCDGIQGAFTDPAWAQSVTVSPNTPYNISVWVNNLDPEWLIGGIPAVMAIYVNGELIKEKNLSMNTTEWVELKGCWYSASASGLVEIKITSNTTAGGGNDFGIDDIFFSEASPIPPLNIYASAGIGGSISSPGKSSLDCSGNKLYTITPDPCYHLESLLVDGKAVEAATTYNFVNVQKDHTIEAAFAANAPSIITATAETGGSIIPSGDVSVKCGRDQCFVITAAVCYTIADVVLDINSPNPVHLGQVSSYCFRKVDVPHTIIAKFSPIDTCDPVNHTISTDTSTNGTFNPTGPIAVAVGQSQTFAITADSGYKVGDVFIDGSSIGATISYTFTNVTSNHLIGASFVSDCVSPPSGIVAWWSGDNHAFDISGNNNNGMLYGGMAYGAGKVDTGFVFDGLNDYIQVPNSTSLNIGTGDFSIDGWVKTSQNTGVHVLLDKRITSPYTGYELFLYDGGPGLQLADGTGLPAYTSYGTPISVANNIWHHIAVTIDRDNTSGIKFYVDGVLAATKDPTVRQNSLSSIANLRLGTEVSSAFGDFAGMLDEVEIIDRALDSTEIHAIYLAGIAGKCKSECPPQSLTLGASVAARWNLVSVPANVSNTNVSSVYPTSVPNTAWSYDGSYHLITQMNAGEAYWLKFPLAIIQSIDGAMICQLSHPLRKGWNLIGTNSWPINPEIVETNPPGIIGSRFFGYENGYQTANVLFPGKGYWVKANADGTLWIPNAPGKATISETDPLTSLYHLIVNDAEGNTQQLYFGPSSKNLPSAEMYAMPPLPPSGIFDVRFSSQQMVELFSRTGTSPASYRVDLHGGVYPLIVQMVTPKNRSGEIEIAEMAREETRPVRRLQNNRSMTISDPTVTSFIISVKTDVSLPSSFILHQNYPNPFNPMTTIVFDLPIDAIVTLKIYNLLGQEIVTLANNQPYEGGTHSLEFDARELPSGVYFYSIQVYHGERSYANVKKLVLIR